LSEVSYNIDSEELARVEAIQCNDSSLIVHDYHSGEIFSLFNLETAQYCGRFGQTGQGPGELLPGCVGVLFNDIFCVSFRPANGFIAKYNVDVLRLDIHSKYSLLSKYNIPNSFFSQICMVSDSVFLGAGVYNSVFQYTLFDNRNHVLNYAVEIYNARYFDFDDSNKYLSNQGRLKKHPGKNQFVYSLKNSANIDFFEVTDENKINAIKCLRQKNPVYKPFRQGESSMVIPDRDCIIGYIDVAACDSFVYALYTDKKVTGQYCSDVVLVYDWEGNPVKKYKLNREAYYIAVSETHNRLYAAIRNGDGGWNITSYKLE
jgi:hypothetical protein